MGIAKAPPVSSSSKKTNPYPAQKPNSDPEHHSMSGQQQEYQENIYAAFSNGFHRSMGLAQHDPIRRENNNNKMRGFEPTPPPTLVAPPAQDPSTETGLHPVYETAGMLSEMFNYGPGPGPGHAQSADVLDYRRAVGGLGSDWYGDSRQLVGRDSIGDQHQPQQSDTHHHHQMPSINADSAAAMQLFLTNPPPRSPSPQPQAPPPASGSTLHMLLPSPSGGGEIHSIGAPNPNFWSSAAHINNPVELGGIVEGQGLSLSLSSSLQNLEAAKQAEELRNIGSGDSHNIMFFNQPCSSTSTSTPGTDHFLNNLQQQQSILVHNLQGTGTAFAMGPGSSQGQVQIGFGSGSTSSSLGVVNVLRNSKYAKPAQELLEEFCSVGRGHLKKSKLARKNSVNPNPTTSGGGSLESKDPAQLSAGDRAEHQRRKVKLLSMLDEVDRRYNNYCEQMQMVVNSFDMVMGYGGAMPYTGLAQKAMSRHFRCLKEAIQAEVRRSCEVLGEKDPTGSAGLTKGETPRLKMLEQSLRQQRAFNQMGMGLMEQEAWRPQRGLPERSVNILRAWLFEHFLHPYPSDADKHMLARQTGLSRNQVSNWFINARVRLWKPMVEEMYQQEAKELAEDDDDDDDNDNAHEIERHQTSTTTTSTNNTTFATTSHQSQNPMPSSAAAVASTTVSASASTMTPTPPDSDPSLIAINRPHHQPPPQHATTATAVSQAFLHGTTPANNVGPTTMIQFGTASGDVSLTLGLRHDGNTPDKSAAFSIRDFRSC